MCISWHRSATRPVMTWSVLYYQLSLPSNGDTFRKSSYQLVLTFIWQATLTNVCNPLPSWSIDVTHFTRTTCRLTGALVVLDDDPVFELFGYIFHLYNLPEVLLIFTYTKKRQVAWHRTICRCRNISAITRSLHVTGPRWFGQVDVAAGHECHVIASGSSFPTTVCTVNKSKLFMCFDLTRILSSFFQYHRLRVPLLRNVCCLLRVLVGRRSKSR